MAKKQFQRTVTIKAFSEWHALKSHIVNGDFQAVQNFDLKPHHFTYIPSDAAAPIVHYAVGSHKDQLSILKYVLEKGAYVDAINSSGVTPAHIAIRNGNLRAFEILLRYGCSIDKKNASGVRARDLVDFGGKRMALQNEFNTLIDKHRPVVDYAKITRQKIEQSLKSNGKKTRIRRRRR